MLGSLGLSSQNGHVLQAIPVVTDIDVWAPSLATKGEIRQGWRYSSG
jgi:hypothetical protein